MPEGEQGLTGADLDVEALRSRVRELERQLAAVTKDRDTRLELLSMWARKLRLPNSLAGNAVRRLLDATKPLPPRWSR